MEDRGQLLDIMFLFSHVGLRNWIQDIGLGDKFLYPLSHLTGHTDTTDKSIWKQAYIFY